MIKKYLVCGVLCTLCCPIFSSTQAGLSKAEQKLRDDMKEVYAKIAKNPTDFRNALITDQISIKKSGLSSYLELVAECKTLRDSLIAYLRKSKEPSQEVLKSLFELLKNAPGFLAIFLEKDDLNAHRFVLSKIVDPGIGTLESSAPAPEIRGEMRKNLQLINEHKNIDSNYIKLLKPLTEELG